MSIEVMLCCAAALAAVIVLTGLLLKRNPARRRALPILGAVLAALLLSGCGDTAEPAEEAEATPTPVYQVRYYFGGNLLQTQRLTEGQTPAHLDLTLPGLNFAGWTRGDGAAEQPEQIAASEDCDYYAVTYPVLENHVPFLFADDEGFLHPDAPMTYRALSEALQALAAQAAKAYLPQLPDSDEAIQPDDFREVLLELFPAEAVDAACGDGTDGEAVTRRDAAAVLNQLLGRSGEESVTLRRGAVLAPDVSKTAAEDWDLIEASVSHTVDAWGEAWSVCAIPARYEPGFLPLNGKLYYIEENGGILRDAEHDGFLFGADGVYTSGDPELDQYVVDVLAGIAREHPDAEPIEQLRAAYEYSRDSFTFFLTAPKAFGETGWETESALNMMSTLRGNCYDYAAVFWALARGLGYDARAYSGQISDAPHGWVEITIDGTEYLFDPDLEMAARERGNYLSDRFMMTKQIARAHGVYRRQ